MCNFQGLVSHPSIIQQVVMATSGDVKGIGVLEQIHIGPHTRYGFKELLDPAR